ncbi:type II toxin-antitoxin system prevent-host-death family antitoxin [Synechococcales cyanobacterium C]|uniref:Antitoxin n=1 Tax=Petrachloros mirabilis ULC683 TaxID=2781853 RepID=A0A8K1ZZT9_9CYAN|nr:type II toxin-antitoxin system prevent-host-death family antitoxin [Petrachloros mirabilis]NCJ07123.1 type II toxin-antitoxin system prevent-host-death family antitoxin [Petrachloros mirabilis ULC683]
MANIGAFEAKNRLSELLQQVEAGESFVITKHGRPVASLAPIAPNKPVQDTIAQLLSLRKNMKLNGISIQELREEGRRF